MTEAPDDNEPKKPSDRLLAVDGDKIVGGACPAFEEIADDDTLQAVLQRLNLTADDFERVLSFKGVSTAQITFFMGALGYKFSLIRSQGNLSRIVKSALDYIRERQGKKFFDELPEGEKAKDAPNPPSGSHRLPSSSAQEVLNDESRRLCDLGHSKDEIIGGVMASGGVDTAPSMISAFWERSLVEISREAPDTYRSLIHFFRVDRRTADAVGQVGTVVRDGVQQAVRRPDSGRLTGFDTHGGATLKSSDLIQYMKDQGLPVPQETHGDLKAQAQDAHDRAASAIAEMKAKLALPVEAPPEKPEDTGGVTVSIQ